MAKKNGKEIEKLIAKIQKEFKKIANPIKAVGMQNYAKTDMPMYGIQKPERARIEKAIDLNIDSDQMYVWCELARI